LGLTAATKNGFMPNAFIAKDVRQRHETELVDDQELQIGELAPQKPLLVARLYEFMNEAGRRYAADWQALLTGGVGPRPRAICVLPVLGGRGRPPETPAFAMDRLRPHRPSAEGTLKVP
jgi:hypothetical protein